MSNKKRMRYFCAMMVLFMVFSISTNSQAVEFATTTNSVKESVEDYVEDWFYDNFSEHYTLSNYTSSVPVISVDGNSVSATILVGAYTTLKYNSVESLPYMMGIKESLHVSSLAEVVPSTIAKTHSKAATSELKKSVAYGMQTLALSAEEKLSINSEGESTLTLEKATNNLKNSLGISSVQAEYLISMVSSNFVDAAECIGVPTLLTLDITFNGQYNNGSFTNVVLKQKHGEYATESENEIIPLTAAELKRNATMDVNLCLSTPVVSAQTINKRALADNYDRVAARDYAWEHTAPGYGYNQTNPDGGGYTPTTTCGHVFYDDDGNPKYTYVDRSFWNTTDYPSCMANDHCHNDCACFVSQCMVAGGINPTNTWYYSSTKWASAYELIKFITSSEVGGYATTYTNCNAGDIVYWTGHITLCTLNDTVTHRYTGHTNDRNNSKFSSATAYYAINLT